jgi:predicted transcriptional regulator
VVAEGAVSELSPLFLRQPLVLVVRGEEVVGAISREAFFRHLGA